MYVNIPMLGYLIWERNKENKNRERVSIRLLFGSQVRINQEKKFNNMSYGEVNRLSGIFVTINGPVMCHSFSSTLNVITYVSPSSDDIRHCIRCVGMLGFRDTMLSPRSLSSAPLTEVFPGYDTQPEDGTWKAGRGQRTLQQQGSLTIFCNLI